MKKTAKTSIQVSSFHVDEPPDSEVFGPHPWLALASAHVYSEEQSPAELTRDQALTTGFVLQVLEGRGTAVSEGEAIMAAVKNVLFQLASLEEENG
jgi:hypothetical protein